MGSCHGHSKPANFQTKTEVPLTARNDNQTSPDKAQIILSPKIRISGSILTEPHHPMATYIFPRTTTV